MTSETIYVSKEVYKTLNDISRKQKTLETIYVSKAAYKALNDISCRQKGCKVLTLEQYERIFERMSKTGGMKNELIRLDELSMGGGWNNGRWTRWNMADLKKMISELGFEWEQGEELNYAVAESPI